MRRALIFLAVFGLGFALLWTLRGDRPGPAPVEVAPAQGGGEFTQVPMPSGKDGQGRAIGVALDGPLSLTIRGGTGPELRPEIELRAADVDSIGADSYDLKSLEVDLLDPDRGVRRAHMESPLARVELAIDSADPGRSTLRDARLTDVDMTLFEGAPVVPVTFRAPAIDWDVQGAGFTSDARVHVTGQGLEAVGDGLRAALGQNLLVLERKAVVHLELEDGITATLSSGETGALIVRRIEREGVAYVDVTAEEGAKLTVGGATPLQPAGADPMSIEGRTIHLVGRLPAGDRRGYELVSAAAQGDVHARSRTQQFHAQRADFTFGPGGQPLLATLDEDVRLQADGDTFRGRSAEFEFGERGLLSRATLIGEPAGDVGIGRYLAERKPELAALRADIAGAGPLILVMDQGVGIDLAGPASVDVRGLGLALTARESLRGKVASGQRKGELHASGVVTVQYEGRHLDADAIDLFWSIDDAGEVTVDAAAPGRTRVRGAADNGRDVVLNASSGLEARYVGGRLFVPAAQDVHVSIGAQDAPDHVEARARTLRGLNWVARTFEVEGDVEFAGADGQGTAQRAIVRGERDIELFGTAERRATYRLRRRGSGGPESELEAATEAVEIRATERRVQARGDVWTTAAMADELLDLHAARVDLELAPERAGAPAPRPFHAEAQGRVRAHIARPNEVVDLETEWLRIEGRVDPAVPPATRPQPELSLIEARGEVHVTYAGEGRLDARADHFTMDGRRRGRLSAGAGRRVEAHGSFPGALSGYGVRAEWIEFDPTSLRASQVDAQREDASGAPQAPAEAGLTSLRARSIVADRGEILLEGEVLVTGVSPQGDAVAISAGSLRLRGNFEDPRRLHGSSLQSVLAEGGFEARLGPGIVARGERLEGLPGRVRLEGRPARVSMLDAEWSAPWIEYDMANMLLASDRGEITSRPGAPGPSWSLEYESMQPFDQGATTILALRNPRLRFGSTQLVADWTLLWINRDKWQRSGRHLVRDGMSSEDLVVRTPDGLGAQPGRAPAQSGRVARWMEKLRANPMFRLMSEAYVEGNIEVFDVGERRARATALYLDFVEEQGWIQEADVQVGLDVSGQPRKVRAKAEWMRVTSDGELRADTAVLSACDYDEPHYVIETRDLRLAPQINQEDDRVAFQVSAEGNAIRFEGGPAIPLPPLVYETDEEGNPLVDRFVLGNSAKFGAAIGASINAQLGVVGFAFGKFARFALGMPEVPIRGHWNFDVNYLGSRGLLLGAGLEVRLADRFKIEAQMDVIPDQRSDSGLVRVDRDDRSLLRTWFHSRSRHTIEKGDDAQWVDLALSIQSDPGVQAEFFERDYLRYEQKDNYLHWRKASGSDYFSVSAKVLLEDRTDVEELPSVSAFRGRARIGEWFDRPLYHTGFLDAAWLQRRDGDPRYYAPFADGLGDREVLRADTAQRLELPFALGFLNAQGTPYVEGRATAWDTDADDESAPARGAAIVGFEATTTLWRLSSGGTAHTLSPTVGLRADVADFESGGEPVRFDRIEDPYLGRFLDLGVRARWWKPEERDLLDVAVRTSLADGVEGPADDGMQPILVLGRYQAFLGGFPFAARHDGRYDVEDGSTPFAYTLVGFEPIRDLGLELGHHYARDAGGGTLYEAASLAVRWRWTTKWELEAEQTQSLIEDRALGTLLTLRRLGHDAVLEIEVGHRAGEGARFGIGFRPLLSFKRSSLGLIDQWLGVYH